MPGTTIEEVFEDGALPLGEDLRAAVDEWLAYLEHERGSTGNTLEAYERDLRQFLAWLKADLGHAPCLADLARLDARRFRAFMASRRRAGFASRSLARTMSALRAFFRWLEAEEIAKSRAVLQVAMPKVPHGIPKPLTVAKAAAVVDAGSGAQADWVAARDTAVLLLLYGCGLRISEALSLLRKDAPLAGRDVLRIVGKGGKERLVPLLPVTQAAIARYIDAMCALPLARSGRPSVPRRQGRPPEPAHRPAAHGAPARPAGPARHRHAARVTPLLRHAPPLRRRRSAPDPGAARPRQPVHHPGLHRGRPRPPARRLRQGPPPGVLA